MQWNDRARVSSLAAMFAAGALATLVVSGTVITGQRAADAPDAGAMRVLLAKDQIRDQIYNYCRGLDRMDKPLALSVWHPDATVESGGFKGSGPEWIESAWRVHEPITAHTHQMTNILIKVTGDRASSETYFITSLRGEPTATSATTRLIRGRYLDRWSSRNGRWAMDHRRIIVDFTTTEVGSAPNPASAGRRDKTDPSYSIYF